MQYPIAIEWGDEHTATGIVVPDIPGAITAADTAEAAYASAVEAAHIQLEAIAEAGGDIPRPGDLDVHRRNPDYAGWGWGLIDIDISGYLGTTEKVNVTLPSTLIRQIDRYVSVHNLKSRSAFLADVAAEKIGRDHRRGPY
jgi:predicted RNase H-like HicB family nuclease